MGPTVTEQWLTANGCEFFTKTWTPTGTPLVAQVLFVHGFVEHVNRYDHVFAHFAEKGIAVTGYDQRGFGQTAAKTKSQGATSWKQALADISYFVEAAATKDPKTPLFLVSHSMGGALAIAFATRTPALPGLDKLKGVIACAPLLRQAPGARAPALLIRAGSIIGMLAPKMQLKTEVNATAICRDPVVQAAYAADPLCAPVGSYKGVADMLLGGETLVSRDYKNWPADLPLLVLHGTGDLVTCHDASAEFVRKAQADGKLVEFKSYEGFYHEMHNEPADDKWKMIGDLTDWIQSKL